MTDTFLSDHFTAFVDQAYQLDKIDELSYEKLRLLPIETLDDSEQAYSELSSCLRWRLLDRIVRGAEYIEENGPIPVAVKRYDSLCAELVRLDGRVRNESNYITE